MSLSSFAERSFSALTSPRRLLDRLNANPVARAERMHIVRLNLAGRRLRLARLMLLALAINIVALVAEGFPAQIAALTRADPFDVVSLLRLALEFTTLLVVSILFGHNLMVSGLAARLASTGIAREKGARTWEALVLTGIPARRIAIGKWWAAMQVLWVRHRTAIGLRLVLSIWLIVVFVHRELAPAPPMIGIVVVLAFILVVPVITAAFTGALGVISSSIAGSETTAVRINSLIAASAVLLLLGLGCCGAPFLFASVDNVLPLIAGALVFTLIDGGLVGLLVLLLSTEDPAQAATYLAGMGFWMVLFSLITAGALLLAARLLRAQGASRG
ncbi:MAG: hypothetical protein IPK19_02270 [Chloroflexi bacterium]|nr:hypothetical protein [Chloroflexota bacterium]